MTLDTFIQYYMPGEGNDDGARAWRALHAADLNTAEEIQQYRNAHRRSIKQYQDFKQLDNVGQKLSDAIVRGLDRLDAAAIAQVTTMES